MSKNTSSNISIFMIMFGFTFFSGSMLVGREIIEIMPLANCIICILIGGCILGLFGGILAYISCKMRCSMEDLSISTFGRKGSYIASFLISITQIGWYGVGISMFAVPVASLLFPNSRSGLYVLIFLFGSIMTYSTQIGLKAITRMSYIAVPVIFTFGIAIILYSFFQNPSVFFDFEKTRSGSMMNSNMLIGIELVVGSYISGSITTPNFTKNGTNAIIVSIISFSAFCFGNGLMIAFGAISKMMVGGSDIFDLFVHFNLRWLGIIVLGLNIWSSCDNGLYSAGLSLQNITTIKSNKIILCAGIISTLFSLPLYTHFIGFLTVMNRFLPPVGIVLILNYVFPIDKRSDYKWGAIISLLLGCIASYAIPIGIPFINAAIVTTVMHIINYHILKTK